MTTSDLITPSLSDEATPPPPQQTPSESSRRENRRGIRARVARWIKTLHRDPTVEETAIEERRQRLLQELNRAVAEAPDDMPIKYVVGRLNRHHDD